MIKLMDLLKEYKINQPGLEIPKGWEQSKFDPDQDPEDDIEVEAYSAPMEGWDEEHRDYVIIYKTPNNEYYIVSSFAFGDYETDEKRFNSLSNARKHAVEVMEDIMKEWETDDEEELDEYKINKPSTLSKPVRMVYSENTPGKFYLYVGDKRIEGWEANDKEVIIDFYYGAYNRNVGRLADNNLELAFKELMNDDTSFNSKKRDPIMIEIHEKIEGSTLSNDGDWITLRVPIDKLKQLVGYKDEIKEYEINKPILFNTSPSKGKLWVDYDPKLRKIDNKELSLLIRVYNALKPVENRLDDSLRLSPSLDRVMMKYGYWEWIEDREILRALKNFDISVEDDYDDDRGQTTYYMVKDK